MTGRRRTGFPPLPTNKRSLFMARRPLIALLASFLCPGAVAWACSLCANPVNRASLGEEMDLAPVVVYGWLSEPRLNPIGDGAPGAGTTRLTIEKVVKDDAD